MQLSPVMVTASVKGTGILSQQDYVDFRSASSRDDRQVCAVFRFSLIFLIWIYPLTLQNRIHKLKSYIYMRFTAPAGYDSHYRGGVGGLLVVPKTKIVEISSDHNSYKILGFNCGKTYYLLYCLSIYANILFSPEVFCVSRVHGIS